MKWSQLRYLTHFFYLKFEKIIYTDYSFLTWSVVFQVLQVKRERIDFVSLYDVLFIGYWNTIASTSKTSSGLDDFTGKQ
jgi:hypothetical protein